MIEIHKTNVEIDSNKKHLTQRQYRGSMPVRRFLNHFEDQKQVLGKAKIK